MQIKNGIWQNIGIEPDFHDDEGNKVIAILFPFISGIDNYEMYKEELHQPNNKDESIIPKTE